MTLTRRYRVEGSLCSILAPSAPVPQERLEAARQALSEARKQSSSLGEQVQTMRGELADLELQRAEAEGQLQQLQEVRAGMGPFWPPDTEASEWSGILFIPASSQTQAQPPVGKRGSFSPHPHYTEGEAEARRGGLS